MLKEITLILLNGTAIYFLAINLIYALLAIVSWLKIKHFRKHYQNIDVLDLPSVSFLIPAYNEEDLIIETIQTYLSLPHVNKEIIIVNDGSHDQTMRLLQVMFQLKKEDHPTGTLFQSITRPELKVIKASRMGKAEALNYGLQFTTHDLICTMDADTIPTSKGVETCLHAFKLDSKLVAAGGVIQVLSGNELKNNSPLDRQKRKWLNSFQRIEYIRTFICERLGWSFMDSTILISGAFCMIKKDAITKIGGFCPTSMTEDLELIVRLRKFYKGSDYRFKILPVTTCYTQVPITLEHLSRQRMRWQMGLIQTLLQNSSLILHPQHGFLGLMAIPYFWLVEVFSPIMVLISFVLVPFCLFSQWIDPFHVLIFFSAGIIFNLLMTLLGIYFDDKYVTKKKSWSTSASILETILIHFGYKQLNAWWRLKGILKAFSKSHNWGDRPRAEIIHRT